MTLETLLDIGYFCIALLAIAVGFSIGYLLAELRFRRKR